MPARKRTLIRLLKRLPDFLLAVWLIFVLYLNLPLTYDAVQGTTTAKYVFYLTCLIAMAFALANWYAVRAFLKTPLSHWLLCAIALFTLNLVRIQFLELDEEIELDEIDQFQRTVMFPFVAFLAFMVRKRHLILFLKLALLIGPVALVVDFFQPELLGPKIVTREDEAVALRADGLYQNANPAAEAALLCLVLVSRSISRHFLTIAYLTVGVGVMFTFSRSGIGIWLAIGLMLILSGRASKFLAALPIVLFLALGTLAPVLTDVLEPIVGSEKRAVRLVDRLTFWAQDSGEIEEEAEESERSIIALDALKTTLEHPVIGHGVSYLHPTFEVGAHNQLLTMWYKFGILGVLLWGWLFIILLLKDVTAYGWIRPAAMLYLWYTFFSQNLYEHIFWMLFISLSVFMDTQVRRPRGSKTTDKRANPRHTSSTSTAVNGDGKKRRVKRKKKRTPGSD